MSEPDANVPPAMKRLPPEGASSDDTLMAFLDYAADKELTLYPAQEEAILEVMTGSNVILATPTGSGKSLVAEAAHFDALARGQRSFYTSPVKALANEKFFALARAFGSDNVGLMTGDATVNRDAPIICATAEVLASIALSEGARADVDVAVLDEFHYYSDKERGAAWQVPLLALPNTRFLLMSATLGDVAELEKRLTALNGLPTKTVRSGERPVPLDFEYRDTPLHETVHNLVNKDRAPIYLVSFTQRACAEEAQNLMSMDYCTKDEKKLIAEALREARFDSPYGKDIQRYVRHGIGLHHGGLLPKYRLMVEKLAQRGLLKVICGTDTLGVGVNVPIRTVLLTKLCKFDGEKTAILTVRDFQQIAGRAGRKGFDDRGTVVAQAPEHVIENARMEAKAGNDAAKRRKIVKKKPPDRGYVHWDKQTFDKLVTGTAEPLTSRFRVTHGMLIQVLTREEGGGCMAMARLVKRCHERERDKRVIGREALEMTRALLDAAVLERDTDVHGRQRLFVHEDLGEDFSLHRALTLYLLTALTLLDPADPLYPLDVLSMVEATLESPTVVLQKQLDKKKTEKLAELKAAGVEYDERMAELDKIDIDKPLADLVYNSFNEFAAKHPWVKTENIRPKSVARDLYEKCMSFGEYVREYGLERSEGMLLRYLSDAYKALVSTVPAWAMTAEVDELVTWFGAVVRQVDSSLLDEWERTRDKAMLFEPPPERDTLEPEGSLDVTRDKRSFTVLVRNACFRLVRALARRDWADAAAVVEGSENPWDPARFEAAVADFYAEHAELRTDATARAPAHLTITHEDDAWKISQTLLDGEGDDDWFVEARCDLARSRELGRPVLSVLDVRR